jgi:hypothetical protein
MAAFCLVLSVGLGNVQVAHGYLLPAKKILQFVARQTSKVSSFRLEGIVESPDPDSPEGTQRRAVVLYAARPGFLRQEIVAAQETATILVGSGRMLSVLDGHLLEEAARHEEIFPTLLSASSTASLAALLQTEQVDMEQVHLSRMGRQIVYVIGGPPWESEAPQLWCDKQHYWPVRLVGRRSREGVHDVVDIRFLSHREVLEGIWMPTTIEFYRRSELFMRVVVREIRVNENLPEELFDLEAFAAKHPPVPLPERQPERPAEALEEMRRYLEKKYE